LCSARRCQATAQRVRHIVCEPPRTRRTWATDKMWPRGARRHWSVSGPDGARPSQTSRTRPALRVGCARIGAPILAGFLLQLRRVEASPGPSSPAPSSPLNLTSDLNPSCRFSLAHRARFSQPHPSGYRCGCACGNSSAITVLLQVQISALTRPRATQKLTISQLGQGAIADNSPCATRQAGHGCLNGWRPDPLQQVVRALAVLLRTEVLRCLALCVTARALSAVDPYLLHAHAHPVVKQTVTQRRPRHKRPSMHANAGASTGVQH